MPGASERTMRPIEWVGEGEGGVSRSRLRADAAGRVGKPDRGGASEHGRRLAAQ